MGLAYEAIKEALKEIHTERYIRNLRWTEDTLYCKKRGCVCEGCYLRKYPCHLKLRVLDLVRYIGKPENMAEPTTISDKKIENEVQ